MPLIAINNTNSSRKVDALKLGFEAIVDILFIGKRIRKKGLRFFSNFSIFAYVGFDCSLLQDTRAVRFFDRKVSSLFSNGLDFWLFCHRFMETS